MVVQFRHEDRPAENRDTFGDPAMQAHFGGKIDPALTGDDYVNAREHEEPFSPFQHGQKPTAEDLAKGAKPRLLEVDEDLTVIGHGGIQGDRARQGGLDPVDMVDFIEKLIGPTGGLYQGTIDLTGCETGRTTRRRTVSFAEEVYGILKARGYPFCKVKGYAWDLHQGYAGSGEIEISPTFYGLFERLTESDASRGGNEARLASKMAAMRRLGLIRARRPLVFPGAGGEGDSIPIPKLDGVLEVEGADGQGGKFEPGAMEEYDL